jgi:hypothetical protein
MNRDRDVVERAFDTLEGLARCRDPVDEHARDY